MFKPTADEIKNAMSGGKPVFKASEEVQFTVLEVDEKKADDGSSVYVINTMIDNTDNAGKKYSVWCRTATKGGLAQLLSMINCFLTPEQVLEGFEPAMVLVGKRMSCVPKLNNGYANWYDWKLVDSTPAIGGTEPAAAPAFDASDIPF
jgi:hypothetical protein